MVIDDVERGDRHVESGTTVQPCQHHPPLHNDARAVSNDDDDACVYSGNTLGTDESADIAAMNTAQNKYFLMQIAASVR